MSGLDDVVAAETTLSHVDGLAGRLIIRGHSLDDLARSTSFEDMQTLLGAVPLTAETLGAARVEIFALLGHADPSLIALGPVEALRALMARLPDGEDQATAIRLLAAPAVLTPAILRLAADKSPIAPNPALSHAADALTMLGVPSSPAATTALDTYLVTVSDYGMNASTFAARVVASTRGGYTSAVLAALGALKEPLHGGAPGPVLDMLDAIGTAENAKPWLTAALDDGQRLMGFGHRIYRVRDPRADALKAALRRLSESGSLDAGRLALAETIEAEALALLRQRKPDRALETNVEFYTALLLEALGFPREAFTCVFVMGRVGGWLAHAREQIETGRLIRPQSRYIGPDPEASAA